MLTRRVLLSTACASAAALCLPRLARAGGTTPAAIKANRLSERLVMFEGAGGNVVAATSEDGILMVDGGLAQHSAALLERVSAECGGKPLKMLFNTHWHWDHTGSNEAAARAGATIVAHENTKLWMGTDIISRWEGRTYPRRPPEALPKQTFYYGKQRILFGRGTVDYGYLSQAHTDGDIYVFFPEDNVLVAGDVVSGAGYPIVDYSTGGWLGGMIEGLKTLIDLVDDQTRIVPGKGPVLTRANLQAQREMCLAVLTRIGASYNAGQTWNELVASRPTREFDQKWGDPEVFLRTAYHSAWGHLGDIRRVTR